MVRNTIARVLTMVRGKDSIPPFRALRDDDLSWLDQPQLFARDLFDIAHIAVQLLEHPF